MRDTAQAQTPSRGTAWRPPSGLAASEALLGLLGTGLLWAQSARGTGDGEGARLAIALFAIVSICASYGRGMAYLLGWSVDVFCAPHLSFHRYDYL